MAQWDSVFSLAIRLLLISDDPSEEPDVDAAFELHEAAKSQTFLAELVSGKMPAPPGISSSILATEAALMAQKRTLRNAFDDEAPALLPRLAEIQDELDWCWGEMEGAAPAYVRARRAQTVSADEARSMVAALDGQTVWSFFLGDDETVCFVLDGRHPIEVTRLPITRASSGLPFARLVHPSTGITPAFTQCLA